MMEEENLSLSAEELARINAYQNEVNTYADEVMASVEAPEAATAAAEPILNLLNNHNNNNWSNLLQSLLSVLRL